eukprot:1124218-Pyramimonas_sp.AAC.1
MAAEWQPVLASPAMAQAFPSLAQDIMFDKVRRLQLPDPLVALPRVHYLLVLFGAWSCNFLGHRAGVHGAWALLCYRDDSF